MVDPAGEFGWSRSIVGLALSLRWVCSGVFGPPAGWLGDRYGIRRAMDIGAVLFIATSLLIGMVRVPWEFLLSFGILMSMALAVFQVPLISPPSPCGFRSTWVWPWGDSRPPRGSRMSSLLP
jgi:MFS family permease